MSRWFVEMKANATVRCSANQLMADIQTILKALCTSHNITFTFTPLNQEEDTK